MKIIGRTHPGQVRPNNEDAFDYDVEAGVAVLADGMGGLNAGEVASTRTVAAVLEVLVPNHDTAEGTHRTADGTHRTAEDLRFRRGAECRQYRLRIRLGVIEINRAAFSDE